MPIYPVPEHTQRAVTGPGAPDIGSAFDILFKLAQQRKGMAQEGFQTLLQSLPNDTREAILPTLLTNPAISGIFDPNKIDMFPKKGQPSEGAQVTEAFKTALVGRPQEAPGVTPEQWRLTYSEIFKQARAAGKTLTPEIAQAWTDTLVQNKMPEDPAFFDIMGAKEPSDASDLQFFVKDYQNNNPGAPLTDAMRAYNDARNSGKVGELRAKNLELTVQNAGLRIAALIRGAFDAAQGQIVSPEQMAKASAILSKEGPALAAIDTILKFAEDAKAGKKEAKVAIRDAMQTLILAGPDYLPLAGAAGRVSEGTATPVDMAALQIMRDRVKPLVDYFSSLQGRLRAPTPENPPAVSVPDVDNIEEELRKVFDEETINELLGEEEGQ